jgi:RNA polymerase subunit RPABC4/transcription elongation factor Spt4
MFFLIGGVQPRTILIEKQTKVCPFCGHFELQKKRVDHYFSLFFIPLFPVKKGKPFLICHKCQNIPDQNDFSTRRSESELKNCKNCGKSSFGDFSYCPYCGKSL